MSDSSRSSSGPPPVFEPHVQHHPEVRADRALRWRLLGAFPLVGVLVSLFLHETVLSRLLRLLPEALRISVGQVVAWRGWFLGTLVLIGYLAARKATAEGLTRQSAARLGIAAAGIALVWLLVAFGAAFAIDCAVKGYCGPGN